MAEKPESVRKGGSAKGAAKAAAPRKAATASAASAAEPPAKAKSVWSFDPWAPFNAYAKATENMLNAMLPEEKMSLEKLIASIEKGPTGPQVIAAFDFDGTLIGGLSGG